MTTQQNGFNSSQESSVLEASTVPSSHPVDCNIQLLFIEKLDDDFNNAD